MGNLSNLYISESYFTVLHTGNDYTLSAELTDIQDGFGNSSGVSLNTSGDLSISGSFTASLQEGYVWVGDNNNKTTLVSTGSFGGATLPSGVVSGSSQIDYPQISNIPSGIVSSSEQLPSGLVSGSSQIDYTGISNIPSGIVSSSSQIILQDTTGLLSGSRIDGEVALALNSTYAQNTIITGKNLHNTTIGKGTPLYFTGSGTSGNLVGVYPADAGDPTRMPAGGVAGESLAVGAEGIVLLNGFINGVDTSLFASGDEIFVAVGGGYINVAPTGSALIQHLGYVEKSAVNGSGVIQMMGEVRGLPNIQQGYAWVGDSTGAPVAVSTGSFAGTTIDTGSFATTGSNTFTGTQTITGSLIVSESITATSEFINVVDTTSTGVTIDGGTTLQQSNSPLLLVTSSFSGDTDVINTGAVFKNVRVDVDGPLYASRIQTSGFFTDNLYANTGGPSAKITTRNKMILWETDGGSGYVETDLGVSGSVQIAKVMNLVSNDPLPAGNIGDLAVSGSNLFFYNGSWTQVV